MPINSLLDRDAQSPLGYHFKKDRFPEHRQPSNRPFLKHLLAKCSLVRWRTFLPVLKPRSKISSPNRSKSISGNNGYTVLVLQASSQRFFYLHIINVRASIHGAWHMLRIACPFKRYQKNID